MQNLFAPNIFKEKNILITGCSSGIGRETSILLSSLGANLILVGRNKEKIDNLIAQLKNKKAFSFYADLKEEDSIFKEIKNLPEKYLPIDGVFHCAGISKVIPTRLLKPSQINSIFSVSILSALSLSKALCSKGIMADGGSILFMSSIAAIAGTPGMAAYSASKGAIESLCKSLAAELSVRKIRVNTILAGAVKTPLHENLISVLPEESTKDYENKHLLGFGEPISIANLSAFLLSEGSSWITGSSIVIDGGYSAI